jgi:O-antigen ligase
MTTNAVIVPATRSYWDLERVTSALLLGFVASLQVSIALAHILLAAMLLCWAAMLVRERRVPAAPPFYLPLLAYGGVTLIAAAFSIDPVASLIDSKQLFLLLIVPAVYHIAHGDRARTIVDVIVSVGAASAAFGIVQYGVLHYDNLGQRPQGAMSHYMTYSGLLMLVICVAASRIVFGSRDRTWPALVMPALVVALALSFTRSATVGACVAVGLLFALKDVRLLGVLPVLIVAMLALAPDRITARMMSMFDVNDPTRRDRVAMMNTGAAIVGDHPFTGVGPNMVERVYPEYRAAGAVQSTNPHLHNVPLQIAAERGLPALAAWLWFVLALVAGLWRLRRTGSDPMLPAMGLAAVAGMLAAGLFEYNFGDSEFLMLFLVLVTLPFTARNEGPIGTIRTF